MKNDARKVGNLLHIDWNVVPLDVFSKAIDIEKEHTNNAFTAGKIALDHLQEYPDYYQRLIKMEKEADIYWKSKARPNVILPQKPMPMKIISIIVVMVIIVIILIYYLFEYNYFIT